MSVKIPAYNVRDWIERCIESVKRQGDIVREIIVVNDGSKDGTEEIVRRLQGKYGNLRIIRERFTHVFMECGRRWGSM